MPERHIQSIAFGDSDQGPIVEIAFFDTANVRVEGQAVLMTNLQVSLRHPDYREDAEDVMRAAKRLLNNALEDFEESEPYRPEVEAQPAEKEDDEGLGMGHGARS